MSAPREPARETYDAEIRFDGRPGREVVRAYVKMTYATRTGACRPGPALPLRHPLLDEKKRPTLIPGTDYWPAKSWTDVAVIGAACAPGGRPVERMRVAVGVGTRTKQIDVLGRRVVTWHAGQPVFSASEPFVEMPLSYDNAYGGVDARVEPGLVSEGQLVKWATGLDHPGAYPRNPFGKGYVVAREPCDGMELPNLEMPQDPLTPACLVVGDPALWHRQPVPWCFDWLHARMFPRSLFYLRTSGPWVPPPEDEAYAERHWGVVSQDYLDWRDSSDAGDPLGAHPRFYQEASIGLCFSRIGPGTPIKLQGVHPEGRTVEFALPPPPSLEVISEGTIQTLAPRLNNVECLPADDLVTLTYVAEIAPPRTFIPGIHREIDLKLSVEHDRPIPYVTPPTVLDITGIKL